MCITYILGLTETIVVLVLEYHPQEYGSITKYRVFT